MGLIGSESHHYSETKVVDPIFIFQRYWFLSNLINRLEALVKSNVDGRLDHWLPRRRLAKVNYQLRLLDVWPYKVVLVTHTCLKSKPLEMLAALPCMASVWGIFFNFNPFLNIILNLTLSFFFKTNTFGRAYCPGAAKCLCRAMGWHGEGRPGGPLTWQVLLRHRPWRGSAAPWFVARLDQIYTACEPATPRMLARQARPL